MAPGQNDQQKQDKFFVAYTTLDRGSVGSINLSADPKQNYLFVSAIMNYVVWIANRYDGAVVGKIGHAAPTGGQFHWLHVAQHGLSREPVHTVK